MKAELALWDDQLATARKGAIAQLVGANLFVWPYVPSLVVGALALDASVELGVATGLGWLCVPVVGPFMTAALSDDLDDAGRGVLLADGVLQSAGALTFLVGTVIRKNAEHTSPWAAGRAPTTASFQIAPVVTPAITGVGLSGSF